MSERTPIVEEASKAKEAIERIKQDHAFGAVLAGLFERKTGDSGLKSSSEKDGSLTVRGNTQDGLQLLLSRARNLVELHAAPEGVGLHVDHPSQLFSVKASDGIIYKSSLFSSLTSEAGARLVAFAGEVSSVLQEVRERFDGVEIDGSFFVKKDSAPIANPS